MTEFLYGEVFFGVVVADTVAEGVVAVADIFAEAETQTIDFCCTTMITREKTRGMFGCVSVRTANNRRCKHCF
jgi:hypothetical protein